MLLGHNALAMPTTASLPAHPPAPALAPDRLQRIALARQSLLTERMVGSCALVEPWVERSWRRCLASGQEPQHPVVFESVPALAVRQNLERNHLLLQAARPVLQQLGQALASTGYFAILTNAQGVVADVHGPVDRSDPRAALIARIGVDLSEQQVGTTAIGAALGELRTVWLHRGEHFFHDTSCYSCAGAPLFGPWGECVGMLDLTGVDAPERPELKHLVSLSARRIENALVLMQPAALWLRLNWPGHTMGTEADGIVGLDADGLVCCSNGAAREMLPQLGHAVALALPRSHCSDLFALPPDTLFDAARRAPSPIDAPLWSGLHLQLLASSAAWSQTAMQDGSEAIDATPRRLRDVEAAMIRKAVDEARGNVALASQRLGVSRATVYRKLGMRRR